MRVVVGSDEVTDLARSVMKWLTESGHQVDVVGPLVGGSQQWPEVGREVGQRVADGSADTGVVFCWTGTGASIAANKVPGVRAALCTDAQTADGARKWNDANVLVLSNRVVSVPVAEEILQAWFSGEPNPDEADNINSLD